MSKFEVGQKWLLAFDSVVVIVYINDDSIAYKRENGFLDCCTIEYFEHQAIEQVVEPKYRPFANAAEFDAYRDRWILSKTGNTRCRVNSYNDQRVGVSPDWLFWSVAFESYTFEDGRPFGIEVTS